MRHTLPGIPTRPFSLDGRSMQAAGLVGWWPMLAGAGSLRVADLAGGIDLQSHGGDGWFRQPQVGAALDSRAQAGHLEGAIDPSADRLFGRPRASFHTGTVAVWFRPTAGGPTQSLISVSKAADPFRLFSIRWTDSGRIAAFSYGPGGGDMDLETDAVFPPGQDYHFVLSIAGPDSIGQVRMFRNGRPLSFQAWVPLSRLFQQLPELDTITLGGEKKSGIVSARGRALVYEARIYDRPVMGDAVWAMFDPATRFDLCRRALPRRRTPVMATPPPPPPPVVYTGPYGIFGSSVVRAA